MKFNYSRPDIKVDYWLVSKNDLKKVYDFLVKKYSENDVSFKLETKAGNNREYDSLKEFEDDLDEIKNLNETVTHVSISGAVADESGRTHIWLSIFFDSSIAGFHIIGEDKTGAKKDWIDGAYEEMQRLAQSLEVKDIKIRETIKKQYKQRFSGTYIVEDFWEEKMNTLTQESSSAVSPQQVVLSSIGSVKQWYEKPLGQLAILIGGGLILAGVVYFLGWN